MYEELYVFLARNFRYDFFLPGKKSTGHQATQHASQAKRDASPKDEYLTKRSIGM